MGSRFWEEGVTEGWGRGGPLLVVSRALASVLVLVSQRAASGLDHPLERCLMAGSTRAPGGGTRDEACHPPHLTHHLSLHPVYPLSPPTPKGKPRLL